MIKTQYINLDMVPSGVLPVLYCSQYDIGRPLGMVVYNGGEAVDLDSYTVTIEATRSDGTAILTAVTTDGNVGAFATTATMTNQADKYLAKMVIVDSSENRVASLAFVMCVTPKTMDENAESIEEDKSLYQQYTIAVQALIAEVKEDLAAEEAARIAADDALQTSVAALQTGLAEEVETRKKDDTEIARRFNDSYYVDITKIGTIAIPSGYRIQGGCYKGGYLYCIYHTQNTAPMMMGKFDLSTGALVDSFQIAATGHGNGVADFMDDLVLVCDSYTGKIYIVDVVQKTVRHSVSPYSGTLSSIACSASYSRIVLQSGGQNALTGFWRLPYEKAGYDRVYYQEFLFNDIPPKGTALAQDITFAGNEAICCLVTNGYANQEKKKNCIRVMCVNGVHVRDVYFDNSLPEPEVITFNATTNKIIIVDKEGGVYETTDFNNIFFSANVGNSITTLNLRPAVQLSAATNDVVTYTDSHGTHSVDMRFPICESGFATLNTGVKTIGRVGDRYILRFGSAYVGVCEGILTYPTDYIAFRSLGTKHMITFRYKIINEQYAEMDAISGVYYDSTGIQKSIGTVTRTDGETDASFMGRIMTALEPAYTDGAFTSALSVIVRGNNPYWYSLPAIGLPTA